MRPAKPRASRTVGSPPNRELHHYPTTLPEFCRAVSACLVDFFVFFVWAASA